MIQVRTTIRLPDELLREAKAHAASTGRTLTAVIADALRRELHGAGDSVARGRKQFRAHTVGGNGTRPGVDLDDTSGLLDLMDGRDAAP
jgi:predicted transcriptional regulator